MNIQVPIPQLETVEAKIADFLQTVSVDISSYESVAQVALLGDDALDSLGLVQLTMFLGEEFDVAIEDEDFEPENFETVGRLARMIHAKMAGAA